MPVDISRSQSTPMTPKTSSMVSVSHASPLDPSRKLGKKLYTETIKRSPSSSLPQKYYPAESPEAKKLFFWETMSISPNLENKSKSQVSTKTDTTCLSTSSKDSPCSQPKLKPTVLKAPAQLLPQSKMRTRKRSSSNSQDKKSLIKKYTDPLPLQFMAILKLSAP